MALGEYRPPNQINNDEDKYWKLTKTQIIYAVMGLALGLLVFSLFNAMGIVILRILGVIFTILLVCAGIAIGGLTIPNSKYLRGGGLRMDKYLIRKIKKRFMKRYHVLYTKNINRDKIVFYQPKVQTNQENRSLLEDFKSMFGGE